MNIFLRILLPIMINTEPLFWFIGYVNAFWRDSNACSSMCQAQYVDLRDLPIAQRNWQIAQHNLRIHTMRN